MIELDRITLKKYFEISDIERERYDFAMKFAIQFTRPEDTLSVGDVSDLPFGLVKEYMHDLSNMTFVKQIEYLERIRKIDYGNVLIDVFTRALNYLNIEILKLVELEGKTLVSNASAKEIAASESLSDLGYYIQLRELANYDITKIESVKKMSYSTCYLELLARQRISEFEKKLK